MKKLLMAVITVVLIAVISVSATLAYLTDEAAVTNTFTVGQVEITLDETDFDEYGETVASADRVDANEYKLIPGHTYKKDPTIHVDSDSEDCWLFAKIENGLGGNATINIDLTKWTSIDATNNVYAYNEIVLADSDDKDVQIFSEFTYSAAVTDTSADAEKEIKVTAYAIQADGFETAADAWTNAKGQFDPAP